MERESFIFYRSWLDAIEELDDCDKLSILLALSRYALDQDEPDLPAHLKLAFKMVKPTIDNDINKWKSTKQKRSEAAKASHANRAASAASAANAASAADNVNEYVNVNESVRNAHTPAQAPEGATGIVKEYYDFAAWVAKEYANYYGDPAKVTMIADHQYSRLRRTYTKQDVIRAMQELGANQRDIEAHRYNDLFVALRKYLEYLPSKK